MTMLFSFTVILACFAWGLYCGFLTAVFQQPREAHILSSFFGSLVIVFTALRTFE
jgi:hypothetical protein